MKDSDFLNRVSVLFLVQVLLYSVYVFLVISCLLLDAFCFFIVIFILELIRKMQELRIF